MADSHATGSHNFRVCEHHLVCLGSTISAAASHAGTVPSWVVDAEVLLSLQQGPGMQGSDLIWFASAVPGRIDPKTSLCLKSWVPAGPGIDQAAQRRTHSEASLKYTERKNDRPTETAAPDTQNVGRKVWKSLEFELGARLV